MPRRKGELPQQRLHKPSGQSRVRINGRDVYLGPWGSRDAQDAYKALLVSLVENGGELPSDWRPATHRTSRNPDVTITPGRRGNLTVGDLVASSMAAVGAGKTPAELNGCSRWWQLRRVAALLEPYARLPAIEFGPRLLNEVAERLATEPMEHRRGGAPAYRTVTSQRGLIAQVRRVFRDAVAREELPPERLLALETVRGNLPRGRCRPPTRRKPVSDTALEALRGFLPPYHMDALWLIRLTGARPSEVLRARSDDVDTTSTPWVLTVRHHKTERYGEERRLFLGPKARAIVEPRLGGGLLFVNSKGGAITADVLGNAVRRACLRAGVEHWTPYQLRHAALTEVRATVGLDAAQIIGGHAQVSMTERYAAPNSNAAMEAAERLG